MWGWLLSNPTVAAALGIIGAVAVAMWRLLAGAKKAGVDQQKVEEAEARAENLEKLKRAADAAAAAKRVPGDPNDRDNWTH